MTDVVRENLVARSVEAFLPSTFRERYLMMKNLIEAAVQSYLEDLRDSSILAEAMEYSLMTGGQRVRPVLAMFTAEALGRKPRDVVALGLAVELLHTYSLIHDDLPCMDDDDVRRGQPTNHKKFGEGMAVLAGDALLTEAFGVMASGYFNKPVLAAELIRDFAEASGRAGMVGGQAIDLWMRDENALSVRGSMQPAGEAVIANLHRMKTGALLKFCVTGSAKVCVASDEQLRALSEYAEKFGLLFQIADDLADLNEAQVGHEIEPSYVKLLGAAASRAKCAELVAQCHLAIEGLLPSSDGVRNLKDLASYVFERVQK